MSLREMSKLRSSEKWSIFKSKWRKISHVNTNHKKAAVAILISNRAGFNIRTVIRVKEGHYKMTKGSPL